MPGLSDYVVLVRGRSSIYLAGPPLVKAAIGEDATDEELGGAVTHAEVTGLGEYLTENDAHAIALTRELMDKLPWDVAGAPRTFEEPRFNREELLGVVPADERQPYDVREVIARLVDSSDFLEFKPGYGSETVRPPRLPLADTPPQLLDLALTIAIYKLHLSEPDPKISKDYDRALKTLSQISTGVVRLPAEGVEPAAATSSGVETIDRERELSPESLKGFI